MIRSFWFHSGNSGLLLAVPIAVVVAGCTSVVSPGKKWDMCPLFLLIEFNQVDSRLIEFGFLPLLDIAHSGLLESSDLSAVRRISDTGKD